jgi:hypothetical protein
MEEWFEPIEGHSTYDIEWMPVKLGSVVEVYDELKFLERDSIYPLRRPPESYPTHMSEWGEGMEIYVSIYGYTRLLSPPSPFPPNVSRLRFNG